MGLHGPAAVDRTLRVQPLRGGSPPWGLEFPAGKFGPGAERKQILFTLGPLISRNHDRSIRLCLHDNRRLPDLLFEQLGVDRASVNILQGDPTIGKDPVQLDNPLHQVRVGFLLEAISGQPFDGVDHRKRFLGNFSELVNEVTRDLAAIAFVFLMQHR